MKEGIPSCFLGFLTLIDTLGFNFLGIGFFSSTITGSAFFPNNLVLIFAKNPCFLTGVSDVTSIFSSSCTGTSGERFASFLSTGSGLGSSPFITFVHPACSSPRK